MTHRVIVTPEAEADQRNIYRYLRAHAPQAASHWIRRARQAVKTLARHPERCALAPEGEPLHEPIRELLFGRGNRGTYRFLFVILRDSVYILHVRHGSRLPLEPEK
jgi:plasmid stabilization system protein ParE